MGKLDMTQEELADLHDTQRKQDITTTQSHTPTPWQISPYRSHYIEGGLNGKSQTICVTHLVGQTKELSNANAAFIVKAVNCHDELVAEITYLKEEAEVVKNNYEDLINSFIKQKEELVACLQQCADDLHCEVEARYGEMPDNYPSVMKDYQRDIEPITKARAILAKVRHE